jgi:uncharacterized protein YqeY
MPLKDQLNQDLKEAMRASEEVRKTTLRQLLAELRQAELDKRQEAAKKLTAAAGPAHAAADPNQSVLTPEQLASLEQTKLTEEESMAVIQREAKARREAMADSAKAGREDLAVANQAELSIIERYLPQQLSRDQVKALAQAAIAEAGATDLKQIGAVMKLLTPRTKGLADGRLVNEVVRELLAG